MIVWLFRYDSSSANPVLISLQIRLQLALISMTMIGDTHLLQRRRTYFTITGTRRRWDFALSYLNFSSRYQLWARDHVLHFGMRYVIAVVYTWLFRCTTDTTWLQNVIVVVIAWVLLRLGTGIRLGTDPVFVSIDPSSFRSAGENLVHQV